jgi:hypothetical protein
MRACRSELAEGLALWAERWEGTPDVLGGRRRHDHTAPSRPRGLNGTPTAHQRRTNGTPAPQGACFQGVGAGHRTEHPVRATTALPPRASRTRLSLDSIWTTSVWAYRIGLPVALPRPLGFSCGPAGVGISIATRGRDLDRNARLQRSALSSGVRVVGRPPSRRTPRPPLPPPCLSGRSGTAAISGPVPRKAGSPAGRSSTGDPRTSLGRVASPDSGWRSGPASYGVAPRPMMPPRMSRRGAGNAPTGPGHRVPRRCVHARPASDSRIHARTEHRGASLGPDCTVKRRHEGCDRGHADAPEP